ncbi:hypothetical protein Tco_1108954 [Tanacetum coccineum]
MRTRSQSRNLDRQQQQAPPAFVEPFNLEEPIENPAPPIVTMDDNRLLCSIGYEAPDRGVRRMPSLCPRSPRTTLSLSTITSTMKFPNVPSTRHAYAFPMFPSRGRPIWLEKEPPPIDSNMISTKIDETFYEAWDRFNDLSSGIPTSKLQESIDQCKRTFFSKFVNANTASSSGTGSLPSNTVTNPKEDLKGITTRSGVAYQGPTIPTTSSSPKVVERETEPVVAPVPNLKPTIPYPSRRNDERRREKANDQIEKFYEIFKDLSFEISLTDALILMPKFASTLKALIGNKEKLSEMARTPLNEHYSLRDTPANYDDMTANRIDVIELACEEYSQEVLGFSDLIEKLKVCEAKTDKSSIDEPPKVELKDLPPHLEYEFLEGDNKLPVIIAIDLSVEEKAAVIKVLKSHKRAITWKLSDIKGINPEFCTHKILMEEDY